MPVISPLNPAPNSSNAEIRPLTLIVPVVGDKTPVIIFKRVDFPEPFFPIIPNVSPFFIFKLTLDKALNSL